ncbi:MAG: S24 family peptidase [Patescibacteria group bacterium]
MALNDTQRKLLERLRVSIESGESLSLRDIGKEIDLSANTVLYHIRKLEQEGFIVRGPDGKVVRVNSPDANSAIAFLPLLGNAHCGQPLNEIIEDHVTQMIPVPLRILGRNTKKQLFLVRAVGDSMVPKIEDGDLVVMEENPTPQTGSIVVARVAEGFTIKIFKETEKEYILKPYNQKYEPFVFKKNQINQELNLDGTAIGVFKSESNLQDGGGEK